MVEIRWILLGLGLLLIVGIWWWGARLTRNTIPLVSVPTPGDQAGIQEDSHSTASNETTGDCEILSAEEPREWGVPPFEPLSIKTADFEAITMPDTPMSAHVQRADVHVDFEEVALEDEPAPLSASHGMTTPASVVATPERVSSVSKLQKIVTIRVCAPGELRWSGNQLKAALESNGLAFGRYQVFHRKHADGESLYCVASLVEPGTFDLARMPEEEYRGVTLFAVLPGPIDVLKTFDDMIATARSLAESLSGMVQDSKAMPLSPQRVSALREDVARFHALLP